MPPEPAKTKVINPVKAIQEAIRSKMHNSDDPSDASKVFICEEDLKEAWRDHDLVTIFPSTKFNNEEREVIREHFLRVLSILILVGWSNEDLLTKFRPQFLRVAGRRDENLPLSEEELAFLDTSAFIFGQQQFAFYPAIIEAFDRSYIQKIEKAKRLPFSGKPEKVGEGAYGIVSKVVIAPRCLRHISVNEETENRKVIDQGQLGMQLQLMELAAHDSRLQDLHQREQRE